MEQPPHARCAGVLACKLLERIPRPRTRGVIASAMTPQKAGVVRFCLQCRARRYGSTMTCCTKAIVDASTLQVGRDSVTWLAGTASSEFPALSNRLPTAVTAKRQPYGSRCGWTRCLTPKPRAQFKTRGQEVGRGAMEPRTGTTAHVPKTGSLTVAFRGEHRGTVRAAWAGQGTARGWPWDITGS